MGYLVTIQPEEQFNPFSNRKMWFVLNPNGSWNSRLSTHLLEHPDGSISRIRIFGTKEGADKEAARVLAGDRAHGPDPRGAVVVVEVDNKPCSECGDVDGVFGESAHVDPRVCIRILKARLAMLETEHAG